MIFDKILGHEKQITRLKALANQKPSSCSWLFCGPSGVGKKQLALALTQGLFCPNGGCGTCSSCLKIQSGNHPDVSVVVPQGASIKIDQIRSTIKFMSLKSFEGKGKVVIIDEAHLITTQGANSLLKVLEEPPENSYFILITSQRGALLSTIQSRCQRWLFGSLSKKHIKQILPDAPEWAIELGQGQVDLTQRYCEEEYLNIYSECQKTFSNLGSLDLEAGFKVAGQMASDRETSLFAARSLLKWTQEALAIKLGVQSPEENSPATFFSQQLSPDTLGLVGSKINRLEQDIQGNINRTLAFEKFWIDLKQLTSGA